MTATALPGSVAEERPDRTARLAERVSRLRTRAGTRQLELALMIAGGILMPLGIVFIILGWVGASRTPLPFEQNDYLISGGILGLALVIAGGFTYFAYWQTVRIRESRQQAEDLKASLHRLEALLQHAGATGSPGTADTATYVATPTGSMFHRADCPTVAGRDDLQHVSAGTTSLRPCRICDPLGEA